MMISADSLSTGFIRMDTCKCGEKVAIFRSFRTGNEYKSNNRWNKTAFHECKRNNECLCGCGAKIWQWTSKKTGKLYWTNTTKHFGNFHNCPYTRNRTSSLIGVAYWYDGHPEF